MSSVKKLIIFLLLGFIFLSVPLGLANADLSGFPEKSPCFKDEVFITRTGAEPYDPSLDRPVMTNPKIGQAARCLRTTHSFVIPECKKISSSVHFKEETGGFCIDVEDYCSLVGCDPKEKKTEIVGLDFYNKGPFFNRKRTMISPVLREILRRFGEIAVILKPLSLIFRPIEKYLGVNTVVITTFGLIFLLNLFLLSIILLAFRSVAGGEALWHEWKFIGKVFLIALIGFVAEAKLKFLIGNDLLYYLSFFLIMSLSAYLLIFHSIIKKFRILASVLFGILSNPIWILLLGLLIEKSFVLINLQ